MTGREGFPMPRVQSVAVALLVAAVSWSCSSSKPPDNPAPAVPIGGGDVSTLAGKWVGDYSSTETGRTGSITFEFKSGGKVARGDVLMVPKGGFESSAMPQVLQISFVNAEGGVVKGTMDPYQDPSCKCEVVTTFVGRISGDTIEGTFSTNPTGKETISTGRWKMTRQKTD
jgi:hypothetical protein